jgi:ribosomal protein L37AE/L43A
MSSMFFKRIIIADIQQSKAKCVDFSKGINVVTSTENHVGKSSLAKSLYYCLGAEIDYDNTWDKATKLYIALLDIDGQEYKVVRQSKKFALFVNNSLILLTQSVSKDLATIFEKIFNFSVYLPNKQTGKNELAPPVFTYLPYYIDQDSGWSTELYESFSNLDQYKKLDQKTSLYYHLNVYNKWAVDIFAAIDKNKEKIDKLEKSISNVQITLNALTQEASYILPAESIDELELSLSIPKEQITAIVEKISESRDRIQKLQSNLLQHERQLNVVAEYNTIKKNTLHRPANSIFECPKCGYTYEEELYQLVRENYSVQNKDFMIQQIALILDTIRKKLDAEKQTYVDLMAELKEEENKIADPQDDFEKYIKHRGLSDSLKSLQAQLIGFILGKESLIGDNKKLKKQVRNLPNKKEVEVKYAEFTRENLIKLGAWNGNYEGKLKILKPLKGQGTLACKIILAQYIALFMTMEYFMSSVIKFPFIVDSPRGKEPSKTSSEDILKLILNVHSLPQIILITMDFDDFEVPNKEQINIVRLTEKRSLLNNVDYTSNQNEIVELIDLLNSVK